MYLTQTSQLRLRCIFHPNQSIYGICLSQNCEIEQKPYCPKCQSELKHMGCNTTQLCDIPDKVEEHNKFYLNVLASINFLEKNFLELTHFIKEILEGYQINEIFKFVSQIEHLNSLGKTMTTLPKVESSIKEILKTLQLAFQQCQSAKIENLNKFKNEDINLTILQFEQTKRLIETQRIQNNERPLETNTSNQQSQNNQLKELLKQGDKNLKSLEYKEAIECFENALQLEPLNIQAKVGLMNTLQEMNYFKSSLFFNKKLLENNSQNFDAVLNKGVMLNKQKKYDLSIAHIKSKLSNFSDPSQKKQLLKLLTNNYLESDKIQDARNELKQLKTKYGEIIEVFQGLAQCDLQEDKLKEAENNLQKATLINRDDFENKLIQIQIFEKKHEYQKCLDLIENQLQEKIKIEDKENLMKSKAIIYYKQSKFQEAMVSCQQFLEINQDDIHIQFIFGKCLSENRQYLLAQHFFEKVLSQNKDHPDAQHEKNKAQRKLEEQNLQRPDQLNPLTQSVFRKNHQSLSQLPPSEKTHYNLLLEVAKILVNNQYPYAVQFLDECIRSFPLDEQLLVLKAKCYIQNIGIMLEYKNKANSLLNNALTINPKNSEAKFLLEQISRPQTSTVKLQNYK